jgi:hypothetical protein
MYLSFKKLNVQKNWSELLLLFNYVELKKILKKLNSKLIVIIMDCIYEIFISKNKILYIMFHFFIPSFDDT